MKSIWVRASFFFCCLYRGPTTFSPNSSAQCAAGGVERWPANSSNGGMHFLPRRLGRLHGEKRPVAPVFAPAAPFGASPRQISRSRRISVLHTWVEAAGSAKARSNAAPLSISPRGPGNVLPGPVQHNLRGQGSLSAQLQCACRLFEERPSSGHPGGPKPRFWSTGALKSRHFRPIDQARHIRSASEVVLRVALPPAKRKPRARAAREAGDWPRARPCSNPARLETGRRRAGRPACANAYPPPPL